MGNIRLFASSLPRVSPFLNPLFSARDLHLFYKRRSTPILYKKQGCVGMLVAVDTLEQSRFSKSQFMETRVENNLKRRPSSQDCFSILASSVALYSRESGCKQIVINETKVFSLIALQPLA